MNEQTYLLNVQPRFQEQTYWWRNILVFYNIFYLFYFMYRLVQINPSTKTYIWLFILIVFSDIIMLGLQYSCLLALNEYQNLPQHLIKICIGIWFGSQLFSFYVSLRVDNMLYSLFIPACISFLFILNVWLYCYWKYKDHVVVVTL